MKLGVGIKALRLAALASAMVAASPALAQDPSEAEIDALIQASDTPDTALALARRQTGEGDLMGAAATLERVLLADSGPATANVRLYYAAVLCRLGDGQTARAEIARVDGRAVTDAAWDETRQACGDVERPAAQARRGGLRGEIAVGLAYDSDLAGSLLVQLDLPGAVPRDDGLSFTGSARLAGRTPAGAAFFFGNAGVLTRNTLSGASTDYQVGDVTLGFGAGIGGDGELSFGGIARHARIGGDPFVTDLGGEIELGLLMGDGRLTLRGEVVQQSYNGSTAAFSRDGMHYDAGVGYSGGGAVRFWLGAAYEGKDAETARTGYSGGRFYGGIRWTISASDAYASLGGVVRYVEYRDQTGFAPVSEARWLGRAAIGVPIGPEGLAVEGAASYAARDYNPASGFKNYESVGGELRLVWNFGK